MSNGLLVIDVQPEYHASCKHVAEAVAKRINNSRKPVTVFWVGEDYSSDTCDEVRTYLESYGASPTRLAQAKFIEKSYGFFRGWMDNGVAEDIIVQVGQELMRTGKHSSNQLDLEMLLGDEHEDLPCDTLHLPHFDERGLAHFKHFDVCGGGRDECLAEIELYLRMTGIGATRLEHLIY